MINKLLKTVFLLILTVSLFSCESYYVDEETGYSEAGSTLVVRTRAASEESGDGQDGETKISYPVSVYVFDEDDKCAGVTTINSDDESILFELPKGVYDVYAIAGADAATYDLPTEESATKNTVISLKSGKEHGDIMTAHNSVVSGEDEENTLTLSLERKVMLLESVRILDVPDDVTSVSVTISPLHENLLLDGSYQGDNGTYTVNLTKDSDGTTWKNTSTIYLLEQSAQTTVKVLMASAEGNISYSYSCGEELSANYKVNITGTYTGNDISLSGTLTGVAWEGTKNIEFVFDGKGDGGTSTEPTTPANVPEVGTLYKDCYVLKSEQSGDKTSVVLMSTEFRDNLSFTQGDEKSLEAAVNEGLSELSVEGISGWRLPSKAELEYIGENLREINTQLGSYGKSNVFTGSYFYLYRTDENKISSYDPGSKVEIVTEYIQPKNTVILRAFATVYF